MFLLFLSTLFYNIQSNHLLPMINKIYMLPCRHISNKTSINVAVQAYWKYSYQWKKTVSSAADVVIHLAIPQNTYILYWLYQKITYSLMSAKLNKMFYLYNIYIYIYIYIYKVLYIYLEGIQGKWKKNFLRKFISSFEYRDFDNWLSDTNNIIPKKKSIQKTTVNI